jgi:hypothetical protein
VTTDVIETFDMDAFYTWPSFGPGVSWVAHGWVKHWDPWLFLAEDEDGNEYEVEEPGEGEWIERPDLGMVVVTMVGDDRKFEAPVDELVVLDEEEFCHGCGQIGCGW